MQVKNTFIGAVLFFLLMGNGVFAQCTSAISSFPYSESFELNNGGNAEEILVFVREALSHLRELEKDLVEG